MNYIKISNKNDLIELLHNKIYSKYDEKINILYVNDYKTFKITLTSEWNNDTLKHQYTISYKQKTYILTSEKAHFLKIIDIIS